MAESKIKASNVVQWFEGTKSVASGGTASTLATADTSDTNAYYLLIGSVAPHENTDANKQVQARLAGCIAREPLRQAVSAVAVTTLKGNGSTRVLTTYHDYGSAIKLDYRYIVIKLN